MSYGQMDTSKVVMSIVVLALVAVVIYMVVDTRTRAPVVVPVPTILPGGGGVPINMPTSTWNTAVERYYDYEEF